MTLENALEAAKAESKKYGVKIAVVNAPIENGEDESGPYGYCPPEVVSILFRYGKVVEVVSS